MLPRNSSWSSLRALLAALLLAHLGYGLNGLNSGEVPEVGKQALPAAIDVSAGGSMHADKPADRGSLIRREVQAKDSGSGSQQESAVARQSLLNVGQQNNPYQLHVDSMHDCSVNPSQTDCNENLENYHVEWTNVKKAWCCICEKKGCAEEKKEAVAEIEYECLVEYADWELSWSIDKKQWCCDKHNLGCEEPLLKLDPHHPPHESAKRICEEPVTLGITIATDKAQATCEHVGCCWFNTDTETCHSAVSVEGGEDTEPCISEGAKGARLRELKTPIDVMPYWPSWVNTNEEKDSRGTSPDQIIANHFRRAAEEKVQKMDQQLQNDAMQGYNAQGYNTGGSQTVYGDTQGYNTGDLQGDNTGGGQMVYGDMQGHQSHHADGSQSQYGDGSVEAAQRLIAEKFGPEYAAHHAAQYQSQYSSQYMPQQHGYGNSPYGAQQTGAGTMPSYVPTGYNPYGGNPVHVVHHIHIHHDSSYNAAGLSNPPNPETTEQR